MFEFVAGGVGKIASLCWIMQQASCWIMQEACSRGLVVASLMQQASLCWTEVQQFAHDGVEQHIIDPYMFLSS